MEKGFYEASWPRDNIYISCYVHEVMNFRYHWHPDEFEMSILLKGQQHFCRGKENYFLQEGDVIMVSPNEGHASYGQNLDTYAMVIHISAGSFRPLVNKGSTLAFPSCLSDTGNRNAPVFRKIRSLAANMILSLDNGGPYSLYSAKASTEMIISLLCTQMDPIIISSGPDVDEDTQRAMRTVMEYIETNFAEKINLEEIATLTQYNRTYISTLFHKSVGISFYDYLMRVRLQNALKDLVMTDKNMTDIALSNGFADLKSFNSRFREMLGRLPSEYRKNVLLKPPEKDYNHMRYIDCSQPWLREKLMSFMNE